MPKAKIVRKSTWVDMTAFVDVSFLILTFFILATKFKPEEPVEVKFPSSVSADKVPEMDAFLVTIDKEGRVFVQLDDPKARESIANNLNETRQLGLSPANIKSFTNSPSMGVPFAGMKQLLSMDPEQQKNVRQPGIPVPDSTGGELYYWVRDAKSTYAGKKITWLIKADNETKFPVVKNVLEAFKRNDINKFQLVTKFQDAPVGSPLWNSRQDIIKKAGGS
ncbi:ExbD/TolR family protein [Agriterribacter humi]|jgi:biopolymer transport protein ExbD|uniref:ExbD/TolR family protein n=1 Tax=Agriterribacter humi TaxID=1104781 RepID=UPI001264F376|nr:biopolymer transporter ExbD [Agriterribacter humi]